MIKPYIKITNFNSDFVEQTSFYAIAQSNENLSILIKKIEEGWSNGINPQTILDINENLINDLIPSDLIKLQNNIAEIVGI